MTYQDFKEALENAKSSEEAQDLQNQIVDAVDNGEITKAEYSKLASESAFLEDELPSQQTLNEKEADEIRRTYYGLPIY